MAQAGVASVSPNKAGTLTGAGASLAPACALPGLSGAGRLAERHASPCRRYAAVELAIGLAALAVTFLPAPLGSTRARSSTRCLR